MGLRRTLACTGLAAILSACSGASDNLTNYNPSRVNQERSWPTIQEGPYKGLAHGIIEDPEEPEVKFLAIYGVKEKNTRKWPYMLVKLRQEPGHDKVISRRNIKYNAEAVRRIVYPDEGR